MRPRQCYVCSLPVPNDDSARHWEAFRDDDGIRMQYRCPKHRVHSPRQLAIIGDLIAMGKIRGHTKP